MFGLLKRWRSLDLLIELTESQVRVFSLSDDSQFSMIPHIAIETRKGQPFVKACGAEAVGMTGEGVRSENPFDHPRSFVRDFYLAEKLLQHAVFEIHNGKQRVAPRIIMHQREKLEGGLTHVEVRVLRELAFGAGARDVLIYVGEPLNPHSTRYEDVIPLSISE
ncbi:rod shape-determining protein [Thaumasiovibrio subtropicus]|uniref:rod shape-determining protein n=1 Tax=Thaumasiovibrio subtropicus TaxID=1891207 RepID=UPI001FE80717|nr:rod shape-determining protein [Thaumasiovibrio subtropicus]